MIKLNVQQFRYTADEQMYPTEVGPNGETLYAKSVDCGHPPYNAWKDVSVPGLDPSKIFRISGIARSAESTFDISMGTAPVGGVWMSAGVNKITFHSSNDFTTCTVTAYVIYWK